jgi:transcriptional regulator with XRE-family HTH domain
MDEQQSALAKEVRRVRKERKLTQAELAQLANVSKGTIGNFELEKTFPNPGNLHDILRVLGIANPYDGAEVVPLSATVPVEGSLSVCRECGRVLWPESYALTFDILGAYMDTLTPAERLAFMRKITRPITHPANGE